MVDSTNHREPVIETNSSEDIVDVTNEPIIEGTKNSSGN
jgi:hypothetical protein